MTYEVADMVPAGTATFDAGTSLLVSGPTQAGRSRILDLIAGGSANDEPAIVISADLPARQVVEALRERNGFAPGRIGIVDCTEGGTEGAGDGVRVATLSTPADLTGISLEFAKLLNSFQPEDRSGRLRVGVLSVSTLLMYGELQTVFRFLHVFTSRIRSAGMFGGFSLDPDVHDGQTYNTVRAIFDCEATVDGEDTRLKGTGFTVESHG